MVSTKFIQNTGYGEASGLPDDVRDAIEEKISSGFGKVWRGMLQVAASGFGKGVLITAAVVTEGLMGVGGAGALIDGTLVDAGVKSGIGQAMNFLTSTVTGPLALAVGGTIGAVADTLKHHSRITIEMAKIEKKQFEHQRERSKVQEQSVSLSTEPELKTSSKKKQSAQSDKAAVKSFAKASYAGDIAVEPDFFTQREEARKASREIYKRAF